MGLPIGASATPTTPSTPAVTASSDFAAILGGLLTMVVQTPTAAPLVALSFAEPLDSGAVAGPESERRADEGIATVPTDDALEPALPAERAQRKLVESLKRLPRDVDASTESLDSAFLSRLDRVVERMAAAGHEVTVTETRRTPERQRQLYAQGRQQDGPVVTWTLDSRHLSGQAADVRVDGRTDGAGYALLHRIAKEEGLRTLGARDPGHLELPRERGAGDPRNEAGLPMRRTAASQQAMGAIAQVATVARVARVARVADPFSTSGVSVARAGAAPTLPAPAPVDRPALTLVDAGVPRRAASAAAPPAPAPATMVVATAATTPPTTSAPAAAPTVPPAAPPVPAASAVTAGAAGPAGGDGAGHGNSQGDRRGDRRSGSDASGERRSELAREGRGGEHQRLGAPLQAVAAGAHHATPNARLAPAGSLAAERVMDLLATRDAAPARPVSELRLTFDPVADGLHSARIAMSGRRLDATLHTSDPVLARGLEAELGALTRSLERQGLDQARVTVGLDALRTVRTPMAERAPTAEPLDRDAARDVTRDDARGGREQAAARDAQRDQHHARQFGERRTRRF